MLTYLPVNLVTKIGLVSVYSTAQPNSCLLTKKGKTQVVVRGLANTQNYSGTRQSVFNQVAAAPTLLDQVNIVLDWGYGKAAPRYRIPKTELDNYFAHNPVPNLSDWDAWMKIPHSTKTLSGRIAAYTKILYFTHPASITSHPSTHTPTPGEILPILDIRIRTHTRLVSYTFSEYANYCRLVNNVAVSCGVQPDDIEVGLFLMP